MANNVFAYRLPALRVLPMLPVRPWLAAPAALALLVLCAGDARAARPEPGIWDTLVGKSYARARKEVIDAGWRPDHRKAVSAWEQQLQIQYPELRSCTVDRPTCTSYFVAYDGTCLKVVAEGEKVNAFTVRSVHKECSR